MEGFATKIAAYVDSIRDELAEVNRYIHQNPELGSQEYKSSRRLVETLTGHGFAVEMPAAGLETAFVASRSSGSDRPHVAFMCEYDALPNLGHACGHNLISTSSLGAGLAVAHLLPELKGKVSLLGTPSEEILGHSGKVAMIKAGLFKDMDLAICAHPFNQTFLGQRALSINEITVKFAGRSAHPAASQHLGINAYDGVQLTLVGLSFLRQQLRPDARVHWGDLKVGGARNIIPDSASVVVCVRASDTGYTEELTQKAINCAKGAALMTGCQVECDVFEGYRPFRINRTLDRIMTEYLESVGVPIGEPPRFGLSGSSDSGDVSQVVPGTHPMFQIAPDIAVHSVEFCQAAGSEAAFERSLAVAKALALTAVRVMTDPQIRAQARADFEAQD